MSAIDFPNSPTVGQQFTANNGVTYEWTGVFWKVVVARAGASVSFYAVNVAQGYNLAAGAAAVPVVPATVLSGNEGGWYNTANGRFTPPAGRYRIFGAVGSGSSGGATQVSVILEKNGTTTIIGASQTPAAANWNGDPAVDAILDANGTDYFQIYAAANNGAACPPSQTWFGAESISLQTPYAPATTQAAFNVRATATDTLSGPNTLPIFRNSVAAPVKDYDPDNVWDLVNNRFTAPATGRYAFECNAYLYITTSPAQQTGLVLQHQNSAGSLIRNYASVEVTDNVGYGSGFNISMELQMQAGDHVAFFCGLNTAQTLQIIATGAIAGVLLPSTLTFASGRRVG